MNADLREAISRFLMNVYSPENLDTAPVKLRQAVELLDDVVTNGSRVVTAGAVAIDIDELCPECASYFDNAPPDDAL